MAGNFQLKALITGVDQLSPMLRGVRRNAAAMRKQLNSSGLGKITFMDALQGGALAAPFILGVREAIKFESAMADVKKVVNFDTPEQFKAMSDDVLDLSERLPMAADGIAQIVAAGGQSGIAREELNKFAEDAVKMGVAFDQTAAQSGDMMAKWRTAFHLNQEEVVTLADKINYLGNTGAASTGQISAIVTAIGPLGEVAGVNAGQLAAMGSALAGVGIAQDVAATGIKNFMLTMTAGTAATKSQKDAYKALRLDANEIAQGMQTDSEGTMNRVLQTLAKVDKAKQAAVLTSLFGKESVGAIAPLLTNLDTLQKNFKAVGKEGDFAGSMQAEYTARAATTENALKLLQNRVTRLGITVGTVLLPPLNDFMAAVGPIISSVSELAGANPWLIKGLLGAAMGFTVLRLATASATAALALMNGVASMSPIGMIVRIIALSAGFLIANWGTVGPFFMALWELIKAYTVPAWELFKAFAAWTPLGVIIKHWEPISKFFKDLWGEVGKYIEPLMKFMGMDDSGEGITAKVQRAAYAQNQRNGDALGQGDGALLAANAGAQAIAQQQGMAARLGVPPMGDLLKAPVPGSLAMGSSASLLRAPDGQASLSQPPPSSVLGGSLVQQTAARQRTDVQGSMVVHFENPPPGMRADPGQTNQPGLAMTPNVGYRSLGRES